MKVLGTIFAMLALSTGFTVTTGTPSIGEAKPEPGPINIPATLTIDRTSVVTRADRSLVRHAISVAKKIPSTSQKPVKAPQTVKKVVASPRPVTTIPVSGNRALGQRMAAALGWTGVQWNCLNQLFTRESNWRTTAANASGAYGIPQALPGSKMGPGWQTDPAVQIRWGLSYIKSRYGSPCGAWSHSQATGWY